MPGSAVGPATGVRDGRTHETNCLNCGAALVGGYCHVCGQHAHVHRTLCAFAQDFLSGALNFEGKIFKTLPLLAWRPGDLTRRYIDGQRGRLGSPPARFVFAAFLLFATFQIAGGSNGLNKVSVDNQVYHSTDEAIAGVQAKIARLNGRRAKADAEDQPDIDKELADQQKALATLQGFKKNGITNAILANKSTTVDSDIPLLNDAFQRAKANPQLAIYKLQDAASKFSWLRIPISVPFLWLLFPFSRRFKLYDHSVFVTYSLSFMMLLVVTLTLVGGVCLSGVAVAAVLIPPVHIYRQLKGAYSLSRLGALWRAAMLLLFAVIALALFAMTVVVLGMSGYAPACGGAPNAPSVRRLALRIDEPAAGIAGPLLPPRSIVSPAITFLISSPDRVSYSSSAWARDSRSPLFSVS